MKTMLQSSEADYAANDHSTNNTGIPTESRKPFAMETDYLIGLICLSLSFGIFVFAKQSADSPALLFESSFLFSYVIAVFYTIRMSTKGETWFSFWKTKNQIYQPHRLLLWLIWLVSCFSFNTAFPVFHESAAWLSIAIMISAGVCIAFTWEESLTLFFRKLLFLLLGSSSVLWAYYAIYLSWLYPASIIGLVFFGLSIHSFIPFMLCITHFRILSRRWKTYKIPIMAGILLPVLFVIGYVVQWNLISKKIQSLTNSIATQDSDDLPAWIEIGKQMDDDWITKQVMMDYLAYQTPRSDFDFLPRTLNLGNTVRHDPLVLIASLFTKKPDLSQSDRIKLLEVLNDARHYTQERLWSGNNLSTENVVTQIRIYPDFRTAYTEKTLSIANHSLSSWQEEAIYTFYLPEGSVVSSLSLWINDKEEKGYLTTQTKADSAYKTIVGVESRDPSVIHWQEGNTVKVKVFPCIARERRKFKIGITSPLQLNGNRLTYENIYFKGPPSDDASEGIRLDFTKNVSGLKIPFEMEESGANQLVLNRTYIPSWNLSFDAIPLSDKGFVFNSKTYQIKPFKEIPESFSAKKIYLDINKAWTKNEFDSVYALVKNKAVFVYDDGMIQLSSQNKDAIFARLSSWNYSLFPVHAVRHQSDALLITKETHISPNVKDLQETQFGRALRNDTLANPLRTFNIGNELSPYFKTLHELRIVRCEKADLRQIIEMLAKNQFPIDQEKGASKNLVRIDNAKMTISESEDSVSIGAPDHIARLYAYNHMMQQIGTKYLSKDYLKDSAATSGLITEAEQANIVTPISSLIVLETAQDYTRFDIQKSKNSLDNATLKNSGAVPEPHEWALIIIFALLVSYYTFRSYARW
ncbi:MAG: XrtN system VIT domain-containing protein [Dyadobacter sp.]|uniref:XrtN system VIT domain-containing protein n=1 Tax=Dyadobacter sp. TaxID=1914288 RepID=UPI003266E791